MNHEVCFFKDVKNHWNWVPVADIPNEAGTGFLCFLSEEGDEANEKHVASDKNTPIRNYRGENNIQ
jgi:hypothetical protein